MPLAVALAAPGRGRAGRTHRLFIHVQLYTRVRAVLKLRRTRRAHVT